MAVKAGRYTFHVSVLPLREALSYMRRNITGFYRLIHLVLRINFSNSVFFFASTESPREAKQDRKLWRLQ
ncbi:nucleoside-diphosphate-sugar epimerase [Paraburkholderia sp. GAS41]